MKKIFILSSLIFLQGCAVMTMKTSYVSKLNEETNVELSKEIGTSIMTFYQGHFSKAIIITKGSAAKNTDKVKSKVEAGEIYVNYSSVGKADYYYPEGSYDPAGIITSNKGIKLEEGKSYLRYISGIAWASTDFENQIEYTETIRPAHSKDSFKKEFIYNGKTGNNIKFSYREYTESLARPAFTQDLQYDLSESNIIGFQGTRIEIIKATNTDISYKILNGFTQ